MYFEYSTIFWSVDKMKGKHGLYANGQVLKG